MSCRFALANISAGGGFPVRFVPRTHAKVLLRCEIDWSSRMCTRRACQSLLRCEIDWSCKQIAHIDIDNKITVEGVDYPNPPSRVDCMPVKPTLSTPDLLRTW
jgi:hypothetical protein